MALSDTQLAPPARPAHQRVRYVGIDLARFIAIAGMMAAHLLAPLAMFPGVSDSDRELAMGTSLISNGAPAALFAVLGGVSIVFATRKQLSGGLVGKAMASVAVRGVVLIVLGVLLGFVDNNIIVILAYYGVAMILVAPLIKAKSWVLASLAAVLGLGFGWLNITLRRSLEVHMEGPHINVGFITSDPLGTLRAIFVTGEYPAITWVTYLLVGMLIGRALTSATARGALGRTAAKLAVIGGAVFVVSQLVSNWLLGKLIDFGVIEPQASQQMSHTEILQAAQTQLLQVGGSGAPPSPHIVSQLLAVPHSGSIMDLARTIALSALVIGLLVWLCDRERPQASASVATSPGLGARLLDTVRAAGAAPLTIYTTHIVVSGIIQGTFFRSAEQAGGLPETGIPWWVMGPGALALQLAGVLAIGAVLSITKRRGPLETLLSKIVGFVVR
ncbi:MAG: DUF1624 domain-containing protein [Actinobacteria bacterium]|nr:DUF1624 domain-containing protein [Actinomycetota bacterium]